MRQNLGIPNHLYARLLLLGVPKKQDKTGEQNDTKFHDNIP
jgi:hypothetical protein